MVISSAISMKILGKMLMLFYYTPLGNFRAESKNKRAVVCNCLVCCLGAFPGLSGISKLQL